MDKNILRQIQLDLAANSAAYRPNRPALCFSPNEPIVSRPNWRSPLKLSINNRRTVIIFIRFLAYFPEANLSSTSLSSIFWKNSENYHQQPEIIQRPFCLQSCLSSKSSAPGNLQRLFRLQNYLSSKSSAPANIQRLFRLQNCLRSKSSAPGNIQRLFRMQNYLGRKTSAPGNIQRLFRLQNCLSCKSSAPGSIQKLFRLQNVLAANHQLYPANIQRPSE